MIIETGISQLRDPFLLRHNGVYYMYGTGVAKNGDWLDTTYACWRNDTGRLDGGWTLTERPVYVRPALAEKNLWAPEVHFYNGAFYLLATYYSSKTQHRGATILRADSPEGPFVEITDGTLTPDQWDCIDATLYIDPDEQPWLVFVHEWTCTPDHVGTMAAAKLSDDLTRLISEPVELFRGDEPAWATGKITDGCFMYTTRAGRLLMLWSNFGEGGYCEAIARSDNGRLDGKWRHEEKPLFARGMAGDFDGGHGMIFTDADGQSYLCLHAPNSPTPERREMPILIPVHEEGDTLACDF